MRTEKLATRKCPKCGNTVIYDQSKGEKALCPVCHEPINTTALQLKTVEFSCAQCGIQLHASRRTPSASARSAAAKTTLSSGP